MSLYQAYVLADSPRIKAAETIIDQTEPVNFKELIGQLQAGGMSLQKIATAIDSAKGTVQRWANGSIPNYEDGRKLLTLRAVCNGSRQAKAKGV